MIDYDSPTVYVPMLFLSIIALFALFAQYPVNNYQPITYTGIVTQANSYNVASQGGLFSSPSTVPMEKVTITLPTGLNLTQTYQCTYFKLGMQVQVQTAESTSFIGLIMPMLTYGNLTTFQSNAAPINQSYTIQGVPSGC